MILTTKRIQRIVRKSASLLALAAVTVSSLGVFVVPRTNPSGGEAYPCQGGICGCTSAEQCWRSCCCTTLPERLAWAERHGVTPPEFVRQQVAADRRSQPIAGTCCSTKSATCSQGVSPHEFSVKDTGSSPRGPAKVILISAFNHCRGVTAYAAIFGEAICEPVNSVPINRPVPNEWLMQADVIFHGAVLPPPTPPPRILS